MFFSFEDPTFREEQNKKAFEKTLQSIKNDATVQEKPSERYGSKFFLLIKKLIKCLNKKNY